MEYGAQLEATITHPWTHPGAEEEKKTKNQTESYSRVWSC